jgi:hypothetical protein
MLHAVLGLCRQHCWSLLCLVFACLAGKGCSATLMQSDCKCLRLQDRIAYICFSTAHYGTAQCIHHRWKTAVDIMSSVWTTCPHVDMMSKPRNPRVADTKQQACFVGVVQIAQQLQMSTPEHTLWHSCSTGIGVVNEAAVSCPSTTVVAAVQNRLEVMYCQ